MAYWMKQEHLFGKDTYACSACGAQFWEPTPLCPHCRAPMGRIKSDPVWVDEMAEFDEDE